MDNGEVQNVAKEDPRPEKREARTFIDKGVLHVEIPLFMPNGEYIAYGMLYKAQLIVEKFFRHIEREAQREIESKRILTPAGLPPLRH
jgi:hypothetical protein